MKKLNNKGFTLIEIVIVIVIIAILAAMLVPSLTQWIDKSKLKTFTSACGTIKTSAASYVAEQYAVDGSKEIASNATTAFEKAVTDDLGGKTVKYATSVDSSASYTITAFNYEADTITIQDKTFTGIWNGTAWNCYKTADANE